jgi:hypothetical protein
MLQALLYLITFGYTNKYHEKLFSSKCSLLHKDTEAKHAQHVLLGCAPVEFYFSFFKEKHLLNTEVKRTLFLFTKETKT